MPVTPAKLLANRINARKSTGPRSPRGKAVAARNALRHGLHARTLLLAGESGAALETLKQSMIRRLNPRDPLELELAQRVVAVLWKLRRLERYEALLYQKACDERDRLPQATRAKRGLGKRQPSTADVAWQEGSAKFRIELDRLAEHERKLDQTLHRTLRELGQLQKAEVDGPLNEFAAEALAADARANVEAADATARADRLSAEADLAATRATRASRLKAAAAKRAEALEKQRNEAEVAALRVKAKQRRDEAKQRRATSPSSENALAGADAFAPRTRNDENEAKVAPRQMEEGRRVNAVPLGVENEAIEALRRAIDQTLLPKAA